MIKPRDLKGPFSLLVDAIADELVDGCPTTFALGFTDGRGRFCVTFVGSAGADAKLLLRNYVGTAAQFKFKHHADRESAFEHECELFHRIMPPGNFLHPERPRGSHWRCPYCYPHQLQR